MKTCVLLNIFKSDVLSKKLAKFKCSYGVEMLSAIRFNMFSDRLSGMFGLTAFWFIIGLWSGDLFDGRCSS